VLQLYEVECHADHQGVKSGDSQALPIPADIPGSDMSQELTVTRLRDLITMVSAGGGLKHAVAILRHMPKPPEVGVREAIDMLERAWD
jgi:hypothetical protein